MARVWWSNVNPAVGAAGMGETRDGTTHVTAPPWGHTSTERVAWAVWFVGTQPQVYAQFKRFADDFYCTGRRISAEMCINLVRWESTKHAKGDVFEVNSNAKSLLGRLYLLEHPDANLEKRKSWLDLLHPEEWDEILTAWREAHAATGTA
jgi:hypothetical protein